MSEGALQELIAAIQQWHMNHKEELGDTLISVTPVSGITTQLSIRQVMLMTAEELENEIEHDKKMH